MSKPFTTEAATILKNKLEEEQDAEKREVSWRINSEGRNVLLSNDIPHKQKTSILTELGYRYIEENNEEERTDEAIVSKRRWVIYKKNEVVENTLICGSKSLFNKIKTSEEK